MFINRFSNLRCFKVTSSIFLRWSSEIFKWSTLTLRWYHSLLNWRSLKKNPTINKQNSITTFLLKSMIHSKYPRKNLLRLLLIILSLRLLRLPKVVILFCKMFSDCQLSTLVFFSYNYFWASSLVFNVLLWFDCFAALKTPKQSTRNSQRKNEFRSWTCVWSRQSWHTLKL